MHRLQWLWWCLVLVHNRIALLLQGIISVKKSRLKHWSPEIQWPVTGNLWIISNQINTSSVKQVYSVTEGLLHSLSLTTLHSQLSLTVTSEDTPVALSLSAQTILSALLISASSRQHMWLYLLKVDLFTSTLDVTWILDIIAALPLPLIELSSNWMSN